MMRRMLLLMLAVQAAAENATLSPCTVQYVMYPVATSETSSARGNRDVIPAAGTTAKFMYLKKVYDGTECADKTKRATRRLSR